MKKVGIMGGTFNPIHNGHLILAEIAYEQLGLDKVLFMPSNNPPHKDKEDLVSDHHRSYMVKAAISDNPHFEFSDYEFKREGTTYTVDTLMLMRTENPDTEYYFIIGADSFFMIESWKHPDKIMQYCYLVVAGRDHINKDKMDQQTEYLSSKYGARILQLDMPMIQIASEMIRKRLAEKKSIRYYVPEAVYSYINQHNLYLRTFKE